MKMQFTFLMVMLATGLGQAQSSLNVTPASVKITVYAMAASTSTDCSNAVVVKDFGTDGKEFDFMKGPPLGGANVDPGNYKCIIMRMSDVIKFTPAATEGVCIAGTEYTIDVCRAGQGTYTATTYNGKKSLLQYGNTTNCTGSSTSPANDRVYLFLSTDATTTAGGQGSGSAFDRPTSSNWSNGFRLSNSWQVGDSGSGTFVVNFTNQIVGTGSECDLNPPTFGFR